MQLNFKSQHSSRSWDVQIIRVKIMPVFAGVGARRAGGCPAVSINGIYIIAHIGAGGRHFKAVIVAAADDGVVGRA